MRPVDFKLTYTFIIAARCLVVFTSFVDTFNYPECGSSRLHGTLTTTYETYTVLSQ